MNVEKICRCCLTNVGPLLTIYDNGTIISNNRDCLAAMIMEIAQVKPEPNDKLPDKACLTCIRELNQCYAFKLKCENSNRTLQQLFCSKVIVELQSPLKNSKSKDVSKCFIRDGQYVDTCLKPPVESNKTAQIVLDDEGPRIKVENNMEASIHTGFVYKNVPTTSEERSISVLSSPISFPNSVPTNENYTQQPLSNEINENEDLQEFTDSETNYCGSIEFIPEKHETYEPIVILEENDMSYTTHDDVDVDDTEVEFTYENISSPQWVPDEESYLSIVNEDLNVDNVQLLSCNKRVDDLYLEDNCGGGSRYQCAICNKAFYHKSKLTDHFETHEKPYSCKYCKNLFNDFPTLRLHLLGHGNKGTINYLQASKPKRSRKHSKEKKHPCDLCPMSFQANSILINHRRTHTGEKPFKCRYCDRTFGQLSTHTNHEKIHTRDRPYKCQYCDKTFIQKGTLTSHERTHTGEKPHKCQYCHKSFIQLGVKQKHEEIHQRKDIKCSQCDMKFISSSDMSEHIELHH